MGFLDNTGLNYFKEKLLAILAPKSSPIFTGTPVAPTANAGTDTTQIATTAFVNKAFQSNKALIYKGTIGSSGADITTLPSTHYQGWTYRVVAQGTYAGKKCVEGDLIICVVDGNTDNDADWSIVQSDMDGVVIGPDSVVSEHVAVFDGETGKLVKDSGYTIATSVPENALFTDNAVTQIPTDNDYIYEVLFSGSNNNTEQTEGVRKTNTFTYNPSTKELSTGGLVNGYILADASAKNVDTTITNESESMNLPTSSAVAAYVSRKVAAISDNQIDTLFN